ncbi:hypothetical protein EJ04DRAFT_504545 [Polyplosphaeria fusca]|uniref:Uncharacterized protein n=1 Tax=Polyplosphaeria fusca TaxID=682080 RepID=A0A9P4QM12_9PLEO|nr:hypothetical protein EJ04DRAFT_504545 [Polyplosphaeria fusca]
MWQPLGPEVEAKTATWRPSPTERGTFNILSSCVLTLALCVWTALHLNIPEHGKVHQQTWRKCGWLAIGLFAPEFIFVTAFYQKIESNRFKRHMQHALASHSLPQQSRTPTLVSRDGRSHGTCRDEERRGKAARDQESALERHHDWSSTHCQYAAMGGFAFDTASLDANFLPNDRTRMALTPQGLLELVREEVYLLPDISAEEIHDKSKANWFTKGLVCLQATWFCVQIFARFGQHLPISALELNTFAHAFCCLVTYVLWWDKPFDIDQPTIIPVVDARAQKLCAAMCMRSPVGMLMLTNH